MAIYSCNIRSIGRTTHAAGTAGAHLRYIGRERAASEVMAHHMPEDPQKARTWMDGHERDARKNARLCDKIRLALPRELDEAQRAQLVQDYMGDLTQARVPWYAAIHQTGKDAHNPHAHIVVVDRDIETGKRVLALSDSTRDRQKKNLPGPSAVEWVRERWEHHANAALERGGHEARIDRRTLEAQGIDRTPQIHIGPRAQHIDTTVKRPESKVVPDPTPRQPSREIDYPVIDAGRTRRERNAEIIDLNLEREARSEHFETRVLALFEREQRALDRPVEAQLIAGERRRSLEERRIRRALAEEEKRIRAARDAEGRLTKDWLKQRYAPETKALKDSHAEAKAEIARRHAGMFGRFMAAVDFTGRTRQKREDERRALAEQQRMEREALAEKIRSSRQAQAQAVEGRYKPQLEEIARQRKHKLSILAERHEDERRKTDALLQARAAEREQARLVVQKQIEDWKRAQKVKARKDKEALAPGWQRQIEGSRVRDHAGADPEVRKRIARVQEKTKAEKEAQARAKPPARSERARSFEDKAAPTPTPERGKRLKDKWQKERQRRDRSRDRDRGRDFD